MEADIQLDILILGLMLVIVFIVRGLSAIGSMIDKFKFAYGIGTTPLAWALVSSLLDEEAIHTVMPVRSSGAAARHDEGAIA
jgi:hypothetical protein